MFTVARRFFCHVVGPALTATAVPIAEEIDLSKLRLLAKRSNGLTIGNQRFVEFHIAKEVKNALTFVSLDGNSDGKQTVSTTTVNAAPAHRNAKPIGEVKASKTPVQIASSMKNFFVFGNGSVVYWNLNELERDAVHQTLRPSIRRGYNSEQIVSETERLNYMFVVDSHTRLAKDKLELEVNNTLQRLADTVHPLPAHSNLQNGAAPTEQSNAQHWLEILGRQFAFSDALSSSVKLGIWEAQLVTLSEFNEKLICDLESGKRMRVGRSALMRNVGELYRVRHFVNIASATIDTPDVYWDLPHLEAYYARLKAYLSIVSRTRMLNEKLTLCCELTDLLRAHLSDKHHTNLEWLIIGLIATEVCLALAKHLYE